jgi:hypothetical protein
VGALPAPYNRPALNGNTYHDTGIEPVYPFGHGLSYTRFDYADLCLSPDVVPVDGMVQIAVTVTNTGDVSGAEVVQLYLHDPVARTVRPGRELKGFARVELAPGEGARVRFDLHADRCAVYDPAAGWVVEPGAIDVLVGSSSRDIRLEGGFELTGAARTLGGDRALVTPVAVTRVDP